VFDKTLPDRPNLEQYKKQAKELTAPCAAGAGDALSRMQRHHPRFHKMSSAELTAARVSLADAQLVLAREHGFESWPKFAHHLEMLHIIRSLESLEDPVAAFIEVACSPCHADHASGTLEHAEAILARYPEVATANIHTAAILGDDATVRRFLAQDARNATAIGGPNGWDALTHLCFSRYLRLDQTRSDGFVRAAEALLAAGASANTGWTEMIDHPNPRPILESAIYGAAAVARHAGVTRVLLEHGADPNKDEETPYHLPEGYDNTVMQIVLESGRLNATSLACMLLRKADWHDLDGMRMVLEYGGDPNLMTRWGITALEQAIRRDNRLEIIELLLEHHADPSRPNPHTGRTAMALAAHRGRGDVLEALQRRGNLIALDRVDRLIAACARADREAIAAIREQEPALVGELLEQGGTLLAEFAGNDNLEGVRCLLDLGVKPDALYPHGDGYFDIAHDSTALHVAAWHGWPAVVKELIARGAPVNARDGKGRTALMLAVKACVDSYWKWRRSTESAEALLKAGATVGGIELPTGYDELDDLLRQHPAKQQHG
jgi:ankyrin repeat protein